MNGNNTICCQAAQGAKASSATVNATVAFGNNMIVVILALAPWAVQIYFNDLTSAYRYNPICCHAAQEAKASTAIVPSNVTFSNYTSVAVLAFALCDVTIMNKQNSICCHAAQEAKASTAIVPSNVTFSNYTSVAVLALAPWDVTITDRNNTICYHVAQGARASSATVNATVNFDNNMTVHMLALAPCAAWQQIGLFVFTIFLINNVDLPCPRSQGKYHHFHFIPKSNSCIDSGCACLGALSSIVTNRIPWLLGQQL
jgi:hypothetical protein